MASENKEADTEIKTVCLKQSEQSTKPNQKPNPNPELANPAIAPNPVIHKNPKGRSVGAKGYTSGEVEELVTLVACYDKLNSHTWRDIEHVWNTSHETKRFADSLRKKYNMEIKKRSSSPIQQITPTTTTTTTTTNSSSSYEKLIAHKTDPAIYSESITEDDVKPSSPTFTGEISLAQQQSTGMRVQVHYQQEDTQKGKKPKYSKEPLLSQDTDAKSESEATTKEKKEEEEEVEKEEHTITSALKRPLSPSVTDVSARIDGVDDMVKELSAKVAKLEKTVEEQQALLVQMQQQPMTEEPCKNGHNFQLVGQTAIYCTKCGITKKLDL